jgi:hypothetical protein
MKILKFLVTATMAVLLSGVACAQSAMLDRHFKGKSGRDINVGIFASMKPDCTPGTLPIVRLAVSPLHGKIVLKKGKLHATNFKQCLSTDLPAFVALYRSVPGFVGQDVLTLEIISTNGKKQFQRITITVGKSGSETAI